MKSASSGVIWLAVAGIVVPFGSASAQVIDTYLPALGAGVGGVAVDPSQARIVDDYTPLGVRYRGLRISGGIAEAAGYDSNADALNGGHGSPVWINSGSLLAATDWSRNEIHAALTVDDVRYPDRSVQNQTAWTAALGGIYELDRDKLGVFYTHLNLFETSADIGAAISNRPVHYDVDALALSYTAVTRSPLTFIPELDLTQYHFDPVDPSAQTRDQQYRNRAILTERLTSRYELLPGTSALLVLQGTEIRYQDKLPGLPNRDSNGEAVLVGMDFGLTGPVQFRALAGYQRRSYRSDVLSSLDSPIVEARLTWAATRLTSFTLDVTTGDADSASETVVGYTYTSARLRLQHVYQPNLVFGAYGVIQNANYPATNAVLTHTALAQIPENQTILGAGLDVKWLVNRSLRLTANYDFSNQSFRKGDDFSTSEVLVGLQLVF